MDCTAHQEEAHTRPLAIGLFGVVFNFIVDYWVWFTVLGVRVYYALPAWLTPFTFTVYFSITYGMVQYSFVVLMFCDKPNLIYNDERDRIVWSSLLFGGWTLIGVLSRVTAIGEQISIARIMTSQRVMEIMIAVLEYVVLFSLMSKKKFHLTPKRIMGIFAVAVYVHFAMEATLIVTGIRPTDLTVLVFDSLVEFNMGAPVIYLMLQMMLKRHGEEELTLMHTT
ncbi:MAG: hypothetical protein ACP6KW_12075 [Candidatus Thorarchaeota archaeon]